MQYSLQVHIEWHYEKIIESNDISIVFSHTTIFKYKLGNGSKYKDFIGYDYDPV